MSDRYRLVGDGIPQGFLDGRMDANGAARYLLEAGLDFTSFLDTLKAVVIPEGYAVRADWSGRPLYLASGRSVPINLSSGNDNWAGFEEFVNDSARNVNGKWEILTEDEDGDWVPSSGGDKVKGDVISQFLEDSENFHNFMLLFLEQGEEAFSKGDFTSAWKLNRRAIHEMESSGHKHLSPRIARNLTRKLGDLRLELALDWVKNHRKATGELITESKLEELYYSGFTKDYDKVKEGLEKSGMFDGQTWTLSHRKIKVPREYTGSGRVVGEVGSGGSPTDVVNQVILTMTRSQDGSTNVEDLAAAMVMGDSDALSHLDGSFTVPVETIGKIKTGTVTRIIKNEKIDTVETYITFEDLGLNSRDYEELVGSTSTRSSTGLQKLISLFSKRDFNYARDVEDIASGMENASVGTRYRNFVSQTINLRKVINRFLPHSVLSEDAYNLAEEGLFSSVENAGLTTIARLSDGVHGASISTPVYNLGLRLAEGLLREGPSLILEEVPGETRGKLLDVMGGPAETLGHRLDEMLMGIDFTSIAFDQVDYERIGKLIGEHLPEGKASDPRKLGELFSDLAHRAHMRKHLGHPSIMARISLNYITSPEYTAQVFKGVEKLVGRTWRFDEYSQCFVSGKRILPAATIPHLRDMFDGGNRVSQAMLNQSYASLARELHPDPVRGSSEKLEKFVARREAVEKARMKTEDQYLQALNRYESSSLKEIARAVIIAEAGGPEGTETRYAGTYRKVLPESVTVQALRRPSQGQIHAQTQAADAMFSAPGMREAFLGTTLKYEKKDGIPLSRIREMRKESFSVAKEHLLGLDLPYPANELMKEACAGAEEVMSRFTQVKLGDYFEPLQHALALGGIINNLGGEISEVSVISPEGTPPTRSDIFSKKADWREQLSRVPRVEFTDSAGKRHLVAPNISTSGAVDMVHFSVDSEGVMEVHPYEFKAVSKSTPPVAHVGNTGNLEALVHLIGKYYGEGLRLVQSRPMTNISLALGRTTGNVVNITHDATFRRYGNHMDRSGHTATSGNTPQPGNKGYQTRNLMEVPDIADTYFSKLKAKKEEEDKS